MATSRRAVRVAIVVVAAGVVVGACGDDGALGGDAGTNAATDAGHDAGIDAAPPLSGAVEVSAGGRHTCARRASGEVACWGFRGSGGLGDGASPYPACVDGPCSPTAVAVLGLSDAVEIAAGDGRTCAVRATGEVVCWGTFVAAVSDITGAVEVSTSGLHTCARLVSGAVVCWGANLAGELGDGLPSHGGSCGGGYGGPGHDCSLTPVTVAGLTDAVGISATVAHTCAVRASGAVVCWGAGGAGQLGDGALTHSLCDGIGGTPRDCSNVPVTVSGLTDAVEVSGTCARRASGAVVCWGPGGAGQLGDGATAHELCVERDLPVDCALSPVAVSGLADAVALSAGGGNACAVRASGAVVCWGANSTGQLGDGSTSHTTCGDVDCSRVPVAVSGLTDAVALSVSGRNACAVRASGAVVCWGDGRDGQLGDGTMWSSSTPVTVLGPF